MRHNSPQQPLFYWADAVHKHPASRRIFLCQFPQLVFSDTEILCSFFYGKTVDAIRPFAQYKIYFGRHKRIGFVCRKYIAAGCSLSNPFLIFFSSFPQPFFQSMRSVPPVSGYSAFWGPEAPLPLPALRHSVQSSSHSHC